MNEDHNDKAEAAINSVYENHEGSESVEHYCRRHEIESLLILTVTSAYAATREVDQFWQKIRGKTVIEIGAGAGFLALEMAKVAKQVYAIECDPSWSAVFADCLYDVKPPNLTWIFGKAETITPFLRGDIAVIYTRSAKERMRDIGSQMCPEVIFGPSLSPEESYPELPEEVILAAEKFASTVTLDDLQSRRIIKVPKENVPHA